MNPAYRPMLATLVDKPFDDKRWVFETKWDGFRLITEKRGLAARLWSRIRETWPWNRRPPVNRPWYVNRRRAILIMEHRRFFSLECVGRC